MDAQPPHNPELNQAERLLHNTDLDFQASSQLTNLPDRPIGIAESIIAQKARPKKGRRSMRRSVTYPARCRAGGWRSDSRCARSALLG
jgi:hypothetical protein